MSKLVILRIERGNFEQGFPVNLEIRENGKLCVAEVVGILVSAPEIPNRYTKWQQAYYAWGEDENCRWWMRQIKVPPQTNSNYSSGDSGERARKAADDLEKAFNDWLDRSSLEEIKETLLHTVRGDEYVRFIVQTDNLELQKLPWKLWRLLGKWYGNSEVALSSTRAPEKGSLSVPVKILVILGSDENIDIKTDWDILRKRLPTAKLTLLPKPQSEELREKLRSQPWDIIFFAGHSATHPSGNDGRIWINEREYLSPQQLKSSLITAVKKGLKLAIFNSCDGLGLARQLESLRIPHIIVMREPIHDQVAQKFLDYFLTSFAEGTSLHQAVREARDKLKLLDSCSPNASWLPVIFQNPEEPPLFYPQKKLWVFSAIAVTLISGIAVFLSYLIPIFSPQPSACDPQLNKNLPISCGEKALMESKERLPQPKKQQGIQAMAEKKYPEAVKLFTAAWNEKKDPETLIYLNNAKIMADKIDASKIYTIPVVVSISNAPDHPSKNIVKGIAWLQAQVNNDLQKQEKIRVLLADDENKIATAQTIAKDLVKRQDILVVIGHYSSHITINVKNIYQQNKLVLISPSSTASERLTSTDVNNFFFRPVSTTEFAAKRLVDYLSKKKYQKIVIFYTKGKAFSESFKKEFKNHLNNRIKIVGDFDLGEDTSKIKSNVVWAKKEFKDAALMLFPDAYTIPNEPDNKLEVIKENNGELLIAGNNTVEDDKVLALGKQALGKMVVAAPLYPSASTRQKFQEFWGKTERPTWPVILSYDALKMVNHAIQIQVKPSRMGIQKVLANSQFKIEGLSGTITLKGSDRQENTATLIEPDCSSEPCSWRPIQK